MVGQEQLIKTLKSYTLETLPKSMLFIGKTGSGRHTLAKEITSHFGLDLVELDKNITMDELIAIEQAPIATAYLLDLSDVVEKDQNKFLKFIEEPYESVYIIVIANSEASILPTITSRCIKYTFSKYTQDQLLAIKEVQNTDVYKICDTPGLLLNADLKTIPDLMALCNAIIDRIASTSYSGALTATLKINYAENYDKYDFNLFLNALALAAFNSCKATPTEYNLKLYNIISNFNKDLLQIAPIKENYIINLLTRLWEVPR